MRILLLNILVLISISCRSEKKSDAVYSVDTTTAINIPLDPDSVNRIYERVKTDIAVQRQKFISRYHSSKSDSARQTVLQEANQYLFITMTEKLLPLWNGTEWDFNGISETPLKGKIACGYYISTTLKHAGFNLNRYHLAQLHAFGIIDTLAPSYSKTTSLDSMLTKIKSSQDDLYIVGMDYHVGFLLKKGNDVRFIHSSYLNPVTVVLEKAEQSEALKRSGNYYFGGLFSTTDLAEKWIKGTRIIN